MVEGRREMASAQPAPVSGVLIGKPGETLGETLYRTLLEQIMFGDLGGVSRLFPGELATRFGVSPTPVREALSRLALEGYIEAIPRRGFHVRQPAPQQVLDTWQVRLGLELTAGEIVVGRLRDGRLALAEVDALAALQQEIAADRRREAHQRHSELNAEFHRRIVALSANRMLVAIYDSVQLHVLRAWIQRGSTGWSERLSTEAREHQAILAALRARDLDAYATATRAHLTRSLADALDELGETATQAASRADGPGDG